MKVILQRTKKAKCMVEGKITGNIEHGYLILVGFTHNDNNDNIEKMVQKIVKLRIFEDADNKMNLNISEVKGKILSISQFTLYANTSNGNRPSFTESLNPSSAKELYDVFNKSLRKYNIDVEEGIFGAHMDIELVNDGPVTIYLEF